MLFAVLFLVCFACGAPPPPGAEITSLPGWNGPLPSRQFSGLIDIGTPPSGVGTMYMHYWLIESEGNPKTDPLIVWYNGTMTEDFCFLLFFLSCNLANNRRTRSIIHLWNGCGNGPSMVKCSFLATKQHRSTIC